MQIGIWLLDLAKSGTLPAGVIAYGIDQNPTLFPQNPPGNIKFSTNNITSLPEEWSDTFLLVNQRLLISALRKEEWVSAINEMYRVLVPGGWVQLCEIGWWKAGPAVERALSVFKALYDSKGLLFEACREIPHMLHVAGFVDIHTVERHTTLAGEEGAQHRLNSIRFGRAIKPQVISQSGSSVSDEDFESLVSAADDEMENTPDSDKHYTMFYAQKPYV